MVSVEDQFYEQLRSKVSHCHYIMIRLLLLTTIMISLARRSLVQSFSRNIKLRLPSSTAKFLKPQKGLSRLSRFRSYSLVIPVFQPAPSKSFDAFRLFSTIDDKNAGIDSETDSDSSDNSDSDSEEWYEGSADEDNDIDNEIQEQDPNENSEEIDELSSLYQQMCSSLQNAVKAKERKRDALQKELDKAKSLEGTMKRANLIISNLYQLPSGTTSAIVQDWELDGEDVEIVLSDEYSTAQEESDALFAAARKMKRGSIVVNELLADTEQAWTILQDTVLDLEFAGAERYGLDEGRLYLLLDRLERTSKQTGFELKKTKSESKAKSKSSKGKQPPKQDQSFRKFLSPGGCIVLVGRNRRDNESICFQVARGDDIWMHSRGCPGAHVLLQVRRGSPRPTEECMQFAANLASFYSDARTERKAPITTASPKHIQKPKGAPLGAVKVRQELNTLTGYPADVDDELKIARERSGVIWDESGSRSHGVKAKNRKKTKENTKDQVAKKRAEKQAKKKKKQNGPDEANDFW